MREKELKSQIRERNIEKLHSFRNKGIGIAGAGQEHGATASG
jgi:hypothetical protein